MRTTILILSLSISGMLFAQDEDSCDVSVTDNSPKHQLQAQFTCKPDEFTFSIFDRWGKEIYKTDDPDFMWDEKDKNGKQVPEGTYIYTLKCSMDDTNKKVSGHYTVVRED